MRCVERMDYYTVFVRVLNTSTNPFEVPMKTCLPEGSKRATVMMDLYNI